MNELIKELFPLPTPPTTATNFPCGMSNETEDNTVTISGFLGGPEFVE